jgi:hypothetical protein
LIRPSLVSSSSRCCRRRRLLGPCASTGTGPDFTGAAVERASDVHRRVSRQAYLGNQSPRTCSRVSLPPAPQKTQVPATESPPHVESTSRSPGRTHRTASGSGSDEDFQSTVSTHSDRTLSNSGCTSAAVRAPSEVLRVGSTARHPPSAVRLAVFVRGVAQVCRWCSKASPTVLTPNRSITPSASGRRGHATTTTRSHVSGGKVFAR